MNVGCCPVVVNLEFRGPYLSLKLKKAYKT